MTIAAIVTPIGTGGVAVIRISGDLATEIAQKLTGKNLPNRKAVFSGFFYQQEKIDSGIVIYFAAPNSFTGEDVVELQCHGGLAVSQKLLSACIDLGARLAKAGEFTQRAFLNGKIDLIQAEAIADVINAQSQQALTAAQKSLSGEFSLQIKNISQQIWRLRVFIEASLDFSEEELDLLQQNQIKQAIDQVLIDLSKLLTQSQQGLLLNQGIDLAIIGRPNSGKSSIFNCLVGEDQAIVSPYAGTTRDFLHQSINIEGVAVRLIDTAGIRQSDDFVEKEGIKRAYKIAKKADAVLYVVGLDQLDDSYKPLIDHQKIVKIYNKADLISNYPLDGIAVSAKTGAGIDKLKKALFEAIGGQLCEETPFIARERHLQGLKNAQECLMRVKETWNSLPSDLLAEEMKLADYYLGELLGQNTADQLLGAIFAQFCIGK